MSDQDRIIQTTTENPTRMKPIAVFAAAFWVTLTIGLYWFALIHDFWWEW